MALPEVLLAQCLDRLNVLPCQALLFGAMSEAALLVAQHAGTETARAQVPAARLGVARKTVAKALTSQDPPSCKARPPVARA